MAERPDQIERHIQSARTELGGNLHELEDRVKQAADWRTYFQRNPMMMMSLALGGGVLLASMMGKKNEGSPMAQSPRSSFAGPRSHAGETWETLKGALIGLTGLKLRNLLDEALPGFSEQYKKMEREHSTRASTFDHNSGYNPGRELETSRRM